MDNFSDQQNLQRVGAKKCLGYVQPKVILGRNGQLKSQLFFFPLTLLQRNLQAGEDQARMGNGEAKGDTC